MGRRINFGGLVIAGTGFFLTRFTVTLAIYNDPVPFYFAGVVPLVLGLSLAAFGVALTVSDVEASVVRTMALWCVLGTVAMLVLVVLTLLGSTPGGMPDFATVRSRTYLSNFLIGGSVGGTLTGLYAARTRRQRGELRHQANRLEVLNRLLRHEVLNALTAIRGYATLPDGRGTEAQEVIEERTDAIEATIEEVKYLTRRTESHGGTGTLVDLGDCLESSVETVRERYPEASVSLESSPDDLFVRANERLGQVFTHLLENAVVHARTDEPSVEVSVASTSRSVRVSVTDEGPGLPQSKQRLLETGDIGDFENPQTGFGLDIVRLLVESYRGSIETDVGADGTTVTVVLPRAETEGPGLRSSATNPTSVRPATPHLLVTLGAALLAGVVYGVVSEHLGGSVAAIGVFYGFQDPVVGWITHEFHSIVFGFVFAGLVSLAPSAYRDRAVTHVALGAAWGLVLWFVAAGIVAAVWLRLLGVPAPLPNISGRLLVNHLAWGVSLGLFTAAGYTYVLPRVRAVRERVPGAAGSV